MQHNTARKHTEYIPKGWTYQKVDTLKRLYPHNEPERLCVILQKPKDEIEQLAKKLQPNQTL